MNKVTGTALAMAVAAVFSTTAATSVFADSTSSDTMVQCMGVNSCKGKSACKTSTNSCKGKNSCKSQGMMMMTKEDCLNAKGTPKSQ